MATSYKSTPFRSSPYLPPLDMNLFSRVMEVKQQQFNAGAARTQGMIDKLGTLDVMRGVDRDYLNGKINGIVDQINNLGGVDFSDMNVSNQIEGLGSDVYGDDKITNAISSTSSVRNLVKTYNDFKTNPKLKGMYSQVNEAYDMKAVNAYMQNGEVGAAYHGPNTATPYYNYKKDLSDAIEKVKADKNVTMTDNGLYWSKTTHEFISPDRIVAMANDLLTPDAAAQMKRDSWYLYNVQAPASPEQMIQKGLAQYQENLLAAASKQKLYQDQADAAIGDPQARQNYLLLAEKAKQEYEGLKSQEKGLAQTMAKRYGSDPESFGYEVYKNDFFRGLGNRFSVNRSDRDVVENKAEMFRQRMDQAERFHTDDNAYKQDLIRIAKEKNDIEAMKAMTGRLKLSKDKFGNSVWVPDEDALTSSNINTQDPDKLSVTEKSIGEANQMMLKEMDDLSNSFITQLVNDHPEMNLGKITSSNQSPTGILGLLNGSGLLEGVNGRPGLQLDDLSGLEKNKAGLLKSGMSEEGFNYLKTLHAKYQDMMQGKGDGSGLPEGADDLFKQLRFKQLRIEANNKKVASVNEQVLSLVGGLTTAERKVLADFQAQPEKYSAKYRTLMSLGANEDTQLAGIMGLLSFSDDPGVADPVLRSALKKLEKANKTGDLEKARQTYYNQLGSRDVFRVRTFVDNDPYLKQNNLQRYMSSELALSGHATDQEGKPITLAATEEDIHPISVGMMADGSKRYYVSGIVKQKDGDKTVQHFVRVPLDDQNAAKLGVNRDPYDDLNYTVNLLGSAEDIPVYGSKDLAVSVRVVKKNVGNLNDYSSYAQAKFYLLDKEGKKIMGPDGTPQYQTVKIPVTEGRTPSEAFALAEAAIKQAAQNPAHKVTFEEFKDYLMNYGK